MKEQDNYGERYLPETEAIVLTEGQGELFWASVEVLQTLEEATYAFQAVGGSMAFKMTSTTFEVEIPSRSPEAPSRTLMAKVKCIGKCSAIWEGTSCGVGGCNKKGVNCTAPRCEKGCHGLCTKESSVWGNLDVLAAFTPLFLPI